MFGLTNRKAQKSTAELQAAVSALLPVGASLADFKAENGMALAVLSVTPAHTPDAIEALRLSVEAVLKKNGYAAPQIILTAERDAPPAIAPRKKAGPAPALDLPVKTIIAVASGKGGVGKSTVAANLAVTLAAQGVRVGLLDADIYGPSQPKLFGIEDQKPEQGENGQLQAPQAHGVKVMSLGLMVDPEAPMIWRGPMVQSALLQMLRDVDWSGCDILILDMPPGTGDAQLTIAQKVRLAGAVIVSTPQDIALLDARKGIAMFREVNVPILGLIENMSVFCCPGCGLESAIFGQGGAESAAKDLNIPFLGAIPLHPLVREWGDAGTPDKIMGEASPVRLIYDTIAATVGKVIPSPGFPPIRFIDAPLPQSSKV
jgi:ATP-binding protein involved in chromosome partitioning